MPSPFYEKLRNTAERFIRAYQFDESNNPATDASTLEHMKSLRTADCRQSWGHVYMVSQSPPIQGHLDNEGFVKHLLTIAPMIKHSTAKVHDILVDEQRRTAIVQVSHFLRPKGAPEAVENDLVFILEIDESGEKVASAIEYLDAFAMKRIGELIRAGA